MDVVTKALHGAGFGPNPRGPTARTFIYCGAGWAVGQVSAVLAGLWAKSVRCWLGCGPSQCGAGWAVGQVSAVLAGLWAKSVRCWPGGACWILLVC